jgi:hypothetical protein
MKPLGKYVKIDITSVRGNAKNTVEFLMHKLWGMTSLHMFVVVFLGEQHKNAVDESVTHAILKTPPIVINGCTRLIFERQLNNVYFPGTSFDRVRTERDSDLRRSPRSILIAGMIIDAFNDGDRMVYVVCGSAHAQEIFDSLNDRFKNGFTYISKLSSDDYSAGNT